MRIIELRTENIKNLKAIEIRPKGDSVILAGRNGAGKSAVLDSILMALTGKKIEDPIRHGEKRAEINIDMGEFTVRKIFTAGGDRLEVTSNEKMEDGKKKAAFLSPQDMLNKVLGTLSFDPLAFASMKAKPQKELLADLVGLNFAELDKQREALYNERTIKNREIKGGDPGAYRQDPLKPLPLESLISKIPVPDPKTPRVEISMADELMKVQELEKKFQAGEKYKENLRQASESVSTNQTEIQKHRKEISNLEGEIQRLLAENDKIMEETRKVVVPEVVLQEQVDEAREALLVVDEKNKAIRAAIDYDDKIAQLGHAQAEIDRLEDGMMKIDLEKQDKIKAAKFPIEELALEGEIVTYQGKPLSQLSTGEQIRVSTAVAMALNPMMKVILVREGSLLDDDGLKAIIAIAQEKDYQIWIERVSSDKGVGVYLEDGSVAKEV